MGVNYVFNTYKKGYLFDNFHVHYFVVFLFKINLFLI